MALDLQQSRYFCVTERLEPCTEVRLIHALLEKSSYLKMRVLAHGFVEGKQ